jgi:hypothetical protein
MVETSRSCPRIWINDAARGDVLTYADQIETAIADQDIDRLCVCKMLATVLRSKVVPRSLFENRIERVTSI